MRKLALFLAVLPISCAPTAIRPSSVLLAGAYKGPVAAVAPDARDTGEIADLIAETLRVINLPAFDRNLRAVSAEFGPVAQSPFGRLLSSSTIADLYAGHDPAYRFYPARVAWADSDGASSTGRDGSIRLSTLVRDNWRTGSVLGRSLAINSLAHEFSHTLSSRPDRLSMVFADRGFSFGWLRGRPPIASYTIGSAAQCTYLEEHGQMREGLASCLRSYGLWRFTPPRRR